MWHRCTTELERVRRQLRAAGSDPAAIAHAAREGAGVLAALSVALEGERPGALARAARQLARSGELSAYTPAPQKPLSRAPALACACSPPGNPSAVGWVIVVREIALLASELGRVHRARGELDCAQQIETELGVELTHIEATLDHAQPRTGANLDAEAQAAMRARAALPSPDRDAGRQSAGESEDVKRLINPLRGRRPRGR